MRSRCAPKSHYCGGSLPFDVRHGMDIICLEASVATTAGPGLTLIPFFTTQSVHIQQPVSFFPELHFSWMVSGSHKMTLTFTKQMSFEF